MKIRPLGVELFHGDNGTDGHMKLTVAFGNFANASKNQLPRGNKTSQRHNSKIPLEPAAVTKLSWPAKRINHL